MCLDNKLTKVVNLWGGPSIGKSILASKLYVELACHPEVGCAELVNEFAKLLAWNEEHEKLNDQPHVTKGQIYNLSPIGKCEYVVTDSPVHLGLIYSDPNHHNEVSELIQQFKQDKPHHEINILLTRERGSFQDEGRVHNYEESIVIDNQIKEMLHALNIPYVEVSNTINVTELCNMILLHDHE